jgi:ribosomal protein L11 methylase PrmA
VKKLKNSSIIRGSFRDPSGFLFYREGAVYRQVNISYKENYDYLMNSGLYESLSNSSLLIPHEEFHTEAVQPDNVCKIIKPELIPFISYPYEWSFSQLKEAALITLQIQKKSLEFGMTLKDGSAYNIQFRNSKPIFIDTLSFEKYREGQPWVAYRQFCQHFLAPLALMANCDMRLGQLLRLDVDGIPLDLASSLLPFRTWLTFSLLSHIHMHAKSQKYFANKTVSKNGRKMSRLSFLGLVDSLEAAIKKLKWIPKGTVWAEYYEDTNYSPEAHEHKKQIVAAFLEKINPPCVWDLGANTGLFSRISSGKGIQTISFDLDPAAVEKNYRACCEEGETNILPLVLDLSNPSPGIGWENQERMSFLERSPVNTVFALALVHHLGISQNLPLNRIAEFFADICSTLIIEFVPKADSQVQRLLATREDIFANYTQSAFEAEFAKYFVMTDSVRIKDTQRTLYLMQRRVKET